MRLLGKIGSPADNVVLAVFNFGNESRPFGIDGNLYTVAYGNRVGATDSFQTEVPFNLTFHQPVVVGLDEIPAARILYD